MNSILMCAASDGMQAFGIAAGELLLIDRAIRPAPGHVVIAVAEYEFVCRQLCKQGRNIRLQAGDGGADIAAGEGAGLQLLGVVTRVIKSLPV